MTTVLTSQLRASLAAVLVLAVALACGSETKPPTNEPTRAPDPLLSNPSAALSASAERLAQNVSSGKSEFTWSIKRTGFDIKGEGTFAFQAPEALHLKESYEGQGEVPSEFSEANDSELLVRGQEIYLKSPPLGSGWVLFTPAELGSDWNALRSLLDARSPIDYSSVTSALAAAASLRSENEGGRKFQIYEATVDAGILMNALADAYGTQGQTMLANRFSGPVTVEVRLDASTLLPDYLEANGIFDYLGEETELRLSVRFSDLNEPVQIPEAPDDARPVSEL